MTVTPEGPESATMVRSEQQLRIDHQLVATERVRVRRRVVSETRQLSVTVRREELVIDRRPLPDTPVAALTPPETPLVFSLLEEVPVLTMTTRAYELATVTVELVTGEQPITTDLQAERVVVQTTEPRR